MAIKGRKPKPKALRILQGNAGKRPLPENIPEPDVSIPKPPNFLTKDAKKEWKRVAPLLEIMGVLAEIDMGVLAIYCQSFAHWKSAEEWIAENGSTFIIRDKDGQVKYIQQVPHVSLSKQARADMLKAGAEFGMTPSSRSRITVNKKQGEEKSPWAKLGNG